MASDVLDKHSALSPGSAEFENVAYSAQLSIGYFFLKAYCKQLLNNQRSPNVVVEAVWSVASPQTVAQFKRLSIVCYTS